MTETGEPIGSPVSNVLRDHMVGTVRPKLNPALVRFVASQTQGTDGMPSYVPVLVEPAHYRLAGRLGPEVIAEVVRTYEAGATSGELAERLGVSPSGLKGLLHSAGAKVRTPRGLTPDEVIEAERRYLSGWLLREVGDRFGVSTECVRRALLKRGTKPRVGRGGRKRRET